MIRIIDKQSRITIPASMLAKFGLEPGSALNLIPSYQDNLLILIPIVELKEKKVKLIVE
jgi:AbrB family looped-hinge helix DNA binding protein